MRNILYTRRKYEKINPAAFDQVITPQVHSYSDNDLGEKVVTYTPDTPIRAMVDKLSSSEEDADFFRRNPFAKDIILIICYENPVLADPKNRVEWAGKMLEIVDTMPAYARGRWMRVKCVNVE